MYAWSKYISKDAEIQCFCKNNLQLLKQIILLWKQKCLGLISNKNNETIYEKKVQQSGSVQEKISCCYTVV